MTLWTSLPRNVETVPAWSGAPLRAWRWKLTIDRWSVLLAREVTFDGGARWTHATDYCALSVTGHWALGGSHTWYDGANCAFSIGPIHAAWSAGDCAKCPGER